MSTLRGLVRIALAVSMAVAGAAHFVNPRPFMEHLPDFMPLRGELVALTGAIEIGLAALLVGRRSWRRPAGLALAVYLVLVFPANVFAAMSQVPIDGVPIGWVRWARLPVQPLLVAAALWSTSETAEA